MIYPDRGSGWTDEDVPPDRYPMSEANLAAEANTRRVTEGGRAGNVLRFGWFYGPGLPTAKRYSHKARRHVGLVVGRPDSYVSSIHLDDAATAVIAALDVAGGTDNVVDDEPLTKRAYADALAAAAGRTMWVRGPRRAAALFGHRLTSLSHSVRASNRHFREATGWEPVARVRGKDGRPPGLCSKADRRVCSLRERVFPEREPLGSSHGQDGSCSRDRSPVRAPRDSVRR
jgi:nucleoside-diphosphate-sugar epimerase